MDFQMRTRCQEMHGFMRFSAGQIERLENSGQTDQPAASLLIGLKIETTAGCASIAMPHACSSLGLE